MCAPLAPGPGSLAVVHGTTMPNPCVPGLSYLVGIVLRPRNDVIPNLHVTSSNQ